MCFFLANHNENDETKKKLFVCHLCGNTFRQQLGLGRHIKKHMGDLRYQCRECGKRFVQSDKLKRHMVVHSHEKPYTCGICHKNYSQKSHLNVHIKAHVSFIFHTFKYMAISTCFHFTLLVL